ncbi:MAG: hypothetical protein IJL87_07530, partial [Clostridia bacterium]|nr:hypothetical protein [Clostridia bacterium]
DHRNLTNVRVHEMLNGLWAVGVKAYPVMGSFADFRIDDLQKTYAKYASMGVSQDDLLEFVVTQIRRFKPQVAVCHDINGEYGHGMHRVYTDLIIKSLDVTGNSSKFSESAKKYGTWDIPKVYIHLYDQNQIVMDYDQPLSSFGGLTAFQVTQQLGFPCHQSQQATWFLGWLNSKSKAADITKYSPCQFGLYRTKVGADAKKNDMMENIVSYAQQAENERIEQERLEEEARQKELEEQKKQQEEKDNEKNKGNIIDNLDISTDNFKFELNDTTVLILAQVVFLGFILLIILIKSLFRKQ